MWQIYICQTLLLLLQLRLWIWMLLLHFLRFVCWHLL